MSAADHLQHNYFRWLADEGLSLPIMRKQYEGLLKEMHDIPFTWTLWLDENRSGDALSFRQSDFLAFVDMRLLNAIDFKWMGDWATASPSVLEVVMGMARRWSFYYEQPTSFFFETMLSNTGFTEFTGTTLKASHKEYVREWLDNWMARNIGANGENTPFPLKINANQVDMRNLDIWSQMNAYSAEHFQ